MPAEGRSGANESGRAAIAAWAERRAAELVVLYGSRAGNTGRRDSDWDLAVWMSEPPSPSRRLEALAELVTALGEEVHLVFVGPALEPVLGFEIARGGRPIHESREGAWAEARLRLWHGYQDAEPFLRLARSNLAQFVAERADGA